MSTDKPPTGQALPPLTGRPEWQALLRHHHRIASQHLRQFFAEDATRGDRLHAEAAGWYLDYSKQHVNADTLRLLCDLANSSGLAERRAAMFRGDAVHSTEQRASLHTALRAPAGTQLRVNGVDVVGRRSVCAPRWHRLDHRQRRHHRRPAVGRNHGPHRPHARIALRCAGAGTGPAGRRPRGGPGQRAAKKQLAALSPDQFTATELAGETISAVLGHAPGNGAPIGGIKVCAPSGWFAARPSGTEDIYKIYAESFQGAKHLQRILQEAQATVDAVLAPAQTPQTAP